MGRKGTVLVTGGSGFVASWCVIALLQQGYIVRTTMRTPGKQDAIRTAIGKMVNFEDRLSFHLADLTADSGWRAAASGCDYMLHVASPLAEPKNPDHVIGPARDGTKRAVSAAIEAGVKRVVVTSSVAAAGAARRADSSASDETFWTALDDSGLSAYSRSKTLAELDAWNLIAASGGTTTLATVNPAVVLGPVLSRDYSASIQIVERLLSGRLPGLPRLGFSIVDVRDVADLHIRAMTAPLAAGQRFIAASRFAWMREMAEVLRVNLGTDARKVPSRQVPDLVVRFAGLFNRNLAALTPLLGQKRDFSSTKAQSLLGWQPRSIEETVLDCARSLIASRVL